jgi:hypothetical protein
LEYALLPYVLFAGSLIMTNSSKKLLANHALKFSKEIAAARLKRAGVTLGKDLQLPKAKLSGKSHFPPGLIKRLAGG